MEEQRPINFETGLDTSEDVATLDIVLAATRRLKENARSLINNVRVSVSRISL